MDAYLRITGQDTDTIFDADFLKLDIDVDSVRLLEDEVGTPLATASIATQENVPYLIHVHLSASQVVVRRAQLGQPLVTILETDSAPLQDTDRFILETMGDCYVDDVNIGHFTTEYAYDALGRRIEKRHADGTATRYVYDGSRVAEEWENFGVYSPP